MICKFYSYFGIAYVFRLADAEPIVKEHHLCVIIPYRDRLEELTEFSPHLHKFLEKQVRERVFFCL